MRRGRGTVAVLLLVAAVALPEGELEAQETRLLPVAIGGVAGLAAGGYVTLSILVARARLENHYVDEISDFFSWTSAPVLIGTATGATLGLLAPERLTRGALMGALGTATGLGVGLVLGDLAWEGPTGPWAGAAIGAGAGLVLGAVIGATWPVEGTDEGGGAARPAGVPVAIRIPL